MQAKGRLSSLCTVSQISQRGLGYLSIPSHYILQPSKPPVRHRASTEVIAERRTCERSIFILLLLAYPTTNETSPPAPPSG